VFARHADDCPARDGRACECGPQAYRAAVRDWEANRRVLSPDFPTAAEAQAWLQDQRASIEAAGRVALESGDLGAVVEEFLQAAEEGRAADPSGERYSPAGIRELRGALSHVAAELGETNIEDVTSRDVQSLVERLQHSGLSAGRVDSVVAGLRALFSYASDRDLVATNPIAVLAPAVPTPASADTPRPEPDERPPTADDVSNTESPAAAPAIPRARRVSGNGSRRPRSAGPTLDSVVRQFLRAADEGSIDQRPGEPYTHETLLDLRGAMSYVDDRLRGMALGDIRRRHVQKLVDHLRSVGLPASVVATVVDSLRALYAFAIQRGLVDFSPVVELSMPPDEFRAPENPGTWSQITASPAPPPFSPAPPPFSTSPAPPPYATSPPPPFATAPPQPAPPQPVFGQAAPAPQPAPGQPQQPSAPDWEFYGSQARETLSPTAAMMRLGGSAVTWVTRLALIAFVLLVLVLARELGLTHLIR
jgi:site-specific recombinase XerD